MPLLKIDVLKGRTEEEIKCLMDAVHEIVLDVFQVPEGDRYQIMTQHEPYEMIIEDTGLGFERSKQVVVITVISTQRTDKMKKEFYQRLAQNLKEKCGIESNDVMVSFVTNGASEWSFGFGKAQFLTGEL